MIRLPYQALMAIIVVASLLYSCNLRPKESRGRQMAGMGRSSMVTISKPYTRYWWFASEINMEDVEFNLDWLKQNGFGGVELAWVYPLNSRHRNLDTTYTPRQGWLSPEWQDAVSHAMRYADSLGLACDLTMGTLWPFGDSYVPFEQAAQQFGEEERQAITRSWEYPKTGYVVDHINPANYLPYFNRMLDSFPDPFTQIPHSYFIDSWEVETRKLWADGFGEAFKERFGYDIAPFMDSLYLPLNREPLYDYMKLLSEKVIAFYSNFDRVLNERNLFSRGQCSGAPCDIISAYARMDIPEGEAMLYEPEFNTIPASAALLDGKKVVSAETFTCIYGWPGQYLRKEQTADLKMVADALFANGVNQIVWHGKAHNPKDQDSVNFYATVHVGKESALAPEIFAFNNYLASISAIMKEGKTYSDIAVYLPTEDAWVKGIMPKEKQFIWAWGYYEMRYIYFPEEVAGYHPVWINKEFLEKARIENNKLLVGDASFNGLYIETEYLDYGVLKRVTELAGKGFPVTLKKEPVEPGSVKHEEYPALTEKLRRLPNVSSQFIPHGMPLIEGDDIPPYWAREEGHSLTIFFANPNSKRLEFPIGYGQSFSDETKTFKVVLNYDGKEFELDLCFEPYQSLLFKIERGEIEKINVSFIPKTPVVGEEHPDENVPWLVK